MESVVHAAPARAERVAALPWHLTAMLVGSTSIVIGLLWDLSWHLTVGRDTFLSPPHVAVYLGGVLAGLSCGAVALRTTFGGSAAERELAVRFWGFRAPLGAWVAIWGALAMLVSAPFDNWWHNAYGLDIDQFTPPHSLLLGGMIVIQFGAMLLALALQNRAPEGEVRRLGVAHLYAAGIALAFLIPVHVMEPNRRHGGSFYEMMGAALPFLLVAVARSSRLRWAATVTSAFYMLIIAMMVWILPLFPAQTRLGPIFTRVDHMAAPFFPLLLVFPALAIDVVLQRRPGKRAGWLDAVALGVGFLAVFFLVHWYTAGFLLSPAARNWFFGPDCLVSYSSPRLGTVRSEFWNLVDDPMTAGRFGIATLLAIVSSRLGLWWGQWMAKVQR
jgi:hypothetical protein